MIRLIRVRLIRFDCVGRGFMPRRRLALTAQGKCNEYCSLDQYSFRGLESGETDWSVSGRFVSGDGFTPADWHASNPIHKGNPENSCLYGKPKLPYEEWIRGSQWGESPWSIGSGKLVRELRGALVAGGPFFLMLGAFRIG